MVITRHVDCRIVFMLYPTFYGCLVIFLTNHVNKILYYNDSYEFIDHITVKLALKCLVEEGFQANIVFELFDRM